MRLVAALLAAALALPAPAAAQELALAPGETLLEVSAEGTAMTVPDVVVMRFGVTTTAASARDAVAANTALAGDLIEVASRVGAEPRNLQTERLSVRPVFEDREERPAAEPRIVGYVANNGLEVRLSDVAKAPALLDAMVAAGANDISGPDFELSDNSDAVVRARTHAVANAMREAEAYAAAFGKEIARVIRISERSARTTGEMIVVTGSRHAAFAPGEVETEVQLWVDFALAER